MLKRKKRDIQAMKDNITRKLIVAEKPDTMKKCIKALEPSSKHIKYKKYTYYNIGNKFAFASFNGHIFQAKMPQEIDESNKTWTTDRLTLPKVLPLQVIPTSQDYFDCLQMLLKDYKFNEIVVCTDADREGQLIWYLVSQNIEINCPVTRVWIKEWTTKGLQKAFNSRKLNSEYHSLEMAGLCRMQSDYIIGLTGTRVNTVLFGGHGNTINEGRVQSPTRYIVGELENEIKNFVPEEYANIQLQITSNENAPLTLNCEKLQVEPATKLNEQLKNTKPQFVISKSEETKKKKCPLLYETNDILVEAGNKFNMKADETTKVLQSLYQEHALTTYPRTDVQKISKSSYDEVMKIVNSLDGAGIVDDIVNEIKQNNYQFSKHLVEFTNAEMPHEAITPTYDGKPAKKFASLNENEKKIYTLICKRFLQGFFPEATIEETKINANIKSDYDQKEYTFKTSGKIIKDPGWMSVMGIPKDNLLPMVTNGKAYDYIRSNVKKKQTQPPKRFTESSLLSAMKNAGKYVESKESKKILKESTGIGTSATRNEIINSCYKNGFLMLKDKTIYPTEKCMQWMDVTPADSPLKSPEMTAELERKLTMVQENKMSFDEFMDNVNKQADEIRIASINAPKKTIASANANDIGICPFCGKPIRENSKSYYCTGYKDGCTFSIWKTIAGKTISKTQAMSLIKNGKTSKIKGFKKKNSNDTFDARLVVDNESKKIKFQFDNFDNSKKYTKKGQKQG